MSDCCEKKRYRTPAEQRALLNRLSRIEGQVRGLKGMIEHDAYCIDIMTQAAAVRAALDSFTRALLETHMKTCVTQNIQAGNTDVIDELLSILKKV